MPVQYLILISILGWGVSNIFYKAAANTGLQPFVIAAIAASVSALLAPLPFIVLKAPAQFNVIGVLEVVCGALCVCGASLAFFYAIKTNGAGQITMATSLYPALTFLLSVLIFKEQINTKQGFGIVLAVASVILLSIK